MSTVQEIEAAIDGLPASEREALEARLLARRYGFDALGSDEYRDLIASLDKAEQDIDAGRTVTADELLQKVGEWAAK